MKKLAFLGGTALLGFAALLANRGYAADHVDSTTLAPPTVAMGDINDVYVWMTSDTTTAPTVGKINLVMTVSPADNDTLSFGPSVQYVFHLLSKTGDPDDVVAKPANAIEYKVICTFASNTSGQCWVTGVNNAVLEHVTGNPSDPATGMVSTSGKLKVFAGRRSDPFFFNLQAFRNVVTGVAAEAGAGHIVPDLAGCVAQYDPDGPGGATPPGPFDTVAASLRGVLSAPVTAGTAPCPAGAHSDCFATLNVKAIVVQLDKSLVTATGNIYTSVWASTHATP